MIERLEDYDEEPLLSSRRLYIDIMEVVDEISQEITATQQSLKKHQAALGAITNNHVITAWLRLDLEDVTKDLTALELPIKTVAGPLARLRDNTPRQHKAIAKLSTELGNLRADISGNFDKGAVMAAAAKNRALHKAIEDIGHDLKHATQEVLTFNLHLRDKLTVANILTLARSSVGARAESFDKGAPLFKDFFLNTPKSGSSDQFQAARERCVAIHKRFTSIQPPELPGIVADTICQYIALGERTSKSMESFIQQTAEQLVSEISTKNLLSHKLKLLKEEDNIEKFFQRLRKIAKSLGELVITVSNKKLLLEELSRTRESAYHLDSLYLLLKKQIFVDLKAEVEAHSSLNPTTTAHKATRDFFYGLKGALRTVKLIFSAIKGKEAVNETELQDILERSIRNCHFYKGDSRDDLRRLQKYIASQINQFSRPFPYAQLFKLIKKTLADYGDQLDGYCKSLVINKELLPESGVSQPRKFIDLIREITKDCAFYEGNSQKIPPK